MYNSIEQSDNYSKSSESLSKHYRSFNGPASNNNSVIIDFPADSNSVSFQFKQKITGQTGNDGAKDVQILVSLKYLSNFWRT